MCKTLESVVRLYHDARFYIHFMENITRTTQIFSYKGSEKTLLKDSKAKSYLKFKRLNNKTDLCELSFADEPDFLCKTV